MSNESQLREFCSEIYFQHEMNGHVILDAKQIEQLNFYLKANPSVYYLSFPVSDTLVIYSDEHIIEYVHYPQPMVKIKKQLVKLIDKFKVVDLHGRTVLVSENGEYLSTMDYYSMKVNLYAMPGFLVELFYNTDTKKIERIEVVTDDKKLTRHLDNIEISELFK